MQDKPIICDLGTGYMKMGYTGENFPSRTFPSVVGRPMLRYEETIDDVQLKPIMVGDQVTKYRSLLELSYPTEEGMVKSWEDMHLLLDYSFKTIGTSNVQGKSIFMTEAVMNPVKNRVKMAQLLFEKFQIGRFQLGIQALMSLFAQGLETAMLVDSGDGVTHCIPVVGMSIMSNQIGRMNLAGRHITNHLVKLMSMRGYAFNSTADFELIREMKEKYCFVSGNFKVDQKLANETTHHEKVHKLPDGTKVKIGSERFMAPEIVFNPILAGLEYDGIGEMVYKSIMKCDLTLRGMFFKNVLISGGTTMFPGFPTRLKNDLEYLHKEKYLKGSVSKDFHVTVNDPPTRKYNVFMGASFVAQTTKDSNRSWVTKQQYEESGARIIEAMTYSIE